MIEKISPTIEDYLGILYILERDGEIISGVRLAALLGVSQPTVTNTLKRMLRDGLISMELPGGTALTPKGLEAASSVMRRHMLAEWMLSRMLSWSKVHQEAHQMEHAISDELEAALLDQLNQPTLCPHGNPLPGNEDLVKDWIPIHLFQIGDHIIIRRIHELAEEQPEVLDFLERNLIGINTVVTVEEVLTFNQTITIRVGNHPVTIGFPLARSIFAEYAPEPVVD
ncbi:MAG: hypothetical protein CVU39_09190 [Chloroflexi bacterium HGW-Chloroflexi-10]|nr:MAG: hypothetical protein CVU39_09190 [Chloroflexi bacterium HGW-Chloroflexi-10]